MAGRTAVRNPHRGVYVYRRHLTVYSVRHRQVIDCKCIKHVLQLLRTRRNTPALICRDVNALLLQAHRLPRRQHHPNSGERTGLLGRRNHLVGSWRLHYLYLLAQHPRKIQSVLSHQQLDALLLHRNRSEIDHPEQIKKGFGARPHSRERKHSHHQQQHGGLCRGTQDNTPAPMRVPFGVHLTKPLSDPCRKLWPRRAQTGQHEIIVHHMLLSSPLGTQRAYRAMQNRADV
ncbi:MAG: hypothetical protein WDM77_10455 [Steroidobacteraceae bacterium]